MKCYLCRKKATRVIATQLRNGPGRVYFCSSCQLGILSAQNAEDLQRYYDKTYRRRHGPVLGQKSNPRLLFESYYRYQDHRISLIKTFLKPDMRLLEIGCSAGQFLFNVRPYVREVVGIDFDARAAAYAAKRCGCKTYAKPLDETDLPLQSFDVICLFQTLEHLSDPLAFLKTVRRYLKPKGILYVEVPNLSDPLLWLYDNPSYSKFYFHAAHLFYFSSKSLAQLMAKAGFSGNISFHQDYNLLNHLSWQATGKPQASCHPGLSPASLELRPRVPLKMKNELNRLIQSTDTAYRALLQKYGATDNISFIGRLYY